MLLKQPLMVMWIRAALILGAFTALCNTPAPAQSTSGVPAATTAHFNAFFQDVLAGRTPDGISATMRSGLTPSLKKEIDSSFQAFGSFQHLQYVSQDSMSGYHRYHYLAVFSKGKPGVIFVTDASGTIVGFFQDAPPTTPGPPPNDALTARFTTFLQDILADRTPTTPMIPKMQSSLTPNTIAEIRQSFASLGAFKNMTYVSHDSVQGYQRYHYRATFANGALGVMFVTDSSGAIAGFFKEQG